MARISLLHLIQANYIGADYVVETLLAPSVDRDLKAQR